MKEFKFLYSSRYADIIRELNISILIFRNVQANSSRRQNI